MSAPNATSIVSSRASPALRDRRLPTCPRRARPLERDTTGAHRGVRGDGWPTPDARLISGGPDHPIARCPLHPSAGYSLVIKEKYHGAKASVWCRVGCDEVALRHVLIEDAERERRARARAEVLVWAQGWSRRRQHEPARRQPRGGCGAAS